MFAMIEFGCALRVSEVLDLEAEDFDLENRFLTLNHTKTGFKKCFKCKGKGGDCTKCKGKGKIQKKQFTSIPQWLIKFLKPFLKNRKGKLFDTSRQLIWKYYKQAGNLAKLDIFEQQEERSISGVWTHLLRKSYAKWMLRNDAKEVLVKVKLRHAFSTTERYTKPDVNHLKQWEEEHPFSFQEIN